MDPTLLSATIEALVFTSELPVTRAMLKQALPDAEPKPIESALEALVELYSSSERGVELKEVAGGWVFRTKPEYAEAISRLRVERPTRLSRAAMETLSIVAYRQPVTRGGVEDIRGVDCGGVLRTLLEKRLVKILGRSDAVGNPLLYGTTPEFLQVFGLRDLGALPTLKEFQELDEESKKLLPEEPAPADTVAQELSPEEAEEAVAAEALQDAAPDA